MAGNETHAPMSASQCINLIDFVGGSQAVLPTAQIEKVEFVGRRGRVVRAFQIDSSDPASLSLEKRQEVSDETASTRHEDANT